MSLSRFYLKASVKLLRKGYWRDSLLVLRYVLKVNCWMGISLKEMDEVSQALSKLDN